MTVPMNTERKKDTEDIEGRIYIYIYIYISYKVNECA